jgi:hypothetical protein
MNFDHHQPSFEDNIFDEEEAYILFVPMSMFWTAFIASLLIFAIVRELPLPFPDFQPLRFIFINIFNEFKEKKERNMNLTSDETCSLCLENPNNQEDEDETERGKKEKKKISNKNNNDEDDDNYFCFFLPCFHKCCKNCASSFASNSDKMYLAQDRNRLFDDDFTTPQEDLRCPFCRQDVLAIAPVKIFSDEFNDDDVDNNDESKNTKEGSTNKWTRLEESFPRALINANHRTYMQHISIRWFTTFLSSSSTEKDETLTQQNRTAREKMKSALFDKGLHFGFKKHRNRGKFLWFLQYDWIFIGTLGLIIVAAIGFLMAFSELFLRYAKSLMDKVSRNF